MGLFRDSSDTLHRGHAVRTLRLCSSSALISDDVPEELEGRKWYGSLTGTWTSPINGLFEFSLSVCGRAKLYIDDEMVIDNWNILQTPGEGFFGQGTQEAKGVLNVSKERKYRIRCEYSNVAGPAAGAAVKDQAQPIHNFGLRLGGFPVTDLDKAMEEAVELAESVDAVMLAVGLSPDFESESYDRPDLSLPSRTNELIERAVAVNPRTIVALQSVSQVYHWITVSDPLRVQR